MIHRLAPALTPLSSGSADSVAYMVQPPAAAPPSTKKLQTIMTTAGTAVQNDSMLSTGKAMSPAPIISGMRKFPNPPTMNGITTKKIMIVACMVNTEL